MKLTPGAPDPLLSPRRRCAEQAIWRGPRASRGGEAAPPSAPLRSLEHFDLVGAARFARGGRQLLLPLLSDRSSTSIWWGPRASRGGEATASSPIAKAIHTNWSVCIRAT